MHTGCTFRCIFHKWRLQTWLQGCVIPYPALLRVMVGTLNCYKIKFCPWKICKSGKSTILPSVRRIHSKAENSREFNMWNHIVSPGFSFSWVLDCLESTWFIRAISSPLPGIPSNQQVGNSQELTTHYYRLLIHCAFWRGHEYKTLLFFQLLLCIILLSLCKDFFFFTSPVLQKVQEETLQAIKGVSVWPRF